MKPLILSFFAVLLGYSFFFDKDDEIKLRNVDQISLESNSTMPERGEAYFNCHTDITIPYDELAELTAVKKDGGRIPIIANGRFVLHGTEELNEPLRELD